MDEVKIDCDKIVESDQAFDYLKRQPDGSMKVVRTDYKKDRGNFAVGFVVWKERE